MTPQLTSSELTALRVAEDLGDWFFWTITLTMAALWALSLIGKKRRQQLCTNQRRAENSAPHANTTISPSHNFNGAMRLANECGTNPPTLYRG